MTHQLVRHGISVSLAMSPAKPSEYIEDKTQIELIVLYLSNPKVIIFTIGSFEFIHLVWLTG